MSQIGHLFLFIVHMSYEELFFSNILWTLLSNLFFVHLKFLNLCVICMLRELEGGTQENILESRHYSWMLTPSEFQILLQPAIFLFMEKESCGI